MPKPDSIRPVSRQIRQVNMAIHGPPGVGKTVLFGTAPNALFIRPPMDHTISAAIQGTTAEEWVVDTWREMDDVLEYMRHEGHKDYEWGFLDSISMFQDAGLDDVYEDTVARKGEGRRQFGPDKGEYGINMHRLMKWIRHMVAIPINFGVSAHSELIELKNGEELWMPWVQGKQMPEKLCGYMNLVGQLNVLEKDDKEYRVLRVRQRGGVYAKDQFDAFPKGRLINPTIPEMVKAIELKMAGKPVAKKATKTTKRRA